MIGCELFNLSEVAARGLIATGIPLATVDGTTLGIEINTDPFRTPRLTRSLVLPESYFSFRPCPVNDLAPDTERVCHYPLFPDATRVAKNDRTYAALGLDPARQTVLLPIAARSSRPAAPRTAAHPVTDQRNVVPTREANSARNQKNSLQLTKLGTDFAEGRLEADITSQGFDVERRSLVIWEGVTNYLTEQAVGETLRWREGGGWQRGRLHVHPRRGVASPGVVLRNGCCSPDARRRRRAMDLRVRSGLPRQPSPRARARVA